MQLDYVAMGSLSLRAACNLARAESVVYHSCHLVVYYTALCSAQRKSLLR
jgi:hypothetical protein